MNFDTGSLSRGNSVTRSEAGAYIARKAEEQGIGNSFKVLYNGGIISRLEELPDMVDLNLLRLSAALDQAALDSWFVLNQRAFVLADCR